MWSETQIQHILDVLPNLAIAWVLLAGICFVFLQSSVFVLRNIAYYPAQPPVKRKNVKRGIATSLLSSLLIILLVGLNQINYWEHLYVEFLLWIQ
jgi:hypothetical protein